MKSHWIGWPFLTLVVLLAQGSQPNNSSQSFQRPWLSRGLVFAHPACGVYLNSCAGKDYWPSEILIVDHWCTIASVDVTDRWPIVDSVDWRSCIFVTYLSPVFLNILPYLGPGSRYYPEDPTLHHCASWRLTDGGWCREPRRIWCWFDIIILANAGATELLIENGRALLWRSHDIQIRADEAAGEQAEKLFGSEYEILGFLNVGWVLLFCVCVWFVFERSFF